MYVEAAEVKFEKILLILLYVAFTKRFTMLINSILHPPINHLDINNVEIKIVSIQFPKTRRKKKFW